MLDARRQGRRSALTESESQIIRELNKRAARKTSLKRVSHTHSSRPVHTSPPRASNPHTLHTHSSAHPLPRPTHPLLEVYMATLCTV